MRIILIKRKKVINMIRVNACVMVECSGDLEIGTRKKRLILMAFTTFLHLQYKLRRHM